jgi:hypothetical protein
VPNTSRVICLSREALLTLTRSASVTERATRLPARRPPNSKGHTMIANDGLIKIAYLNLDVTPGVREGSKNLQSRHAGPYPSHYCGCFSWCALLAHGHRCRNAVTARNVNSIDAFERGQPIALTRRVHALGMPCGRSLRRFPSTKPPRPIISFRTARTSERCC